MSEAEDRFEEAKKIYNPCTLDTWKQYLADFRVDQKKDVMVAVFDKTPDTSDHYAAEMFVDGDLVGCSYSSKDLDNVRDLLRVFELRKLGMNLIDKPNVIETWL